jgi:peptidoglycan hydrolase-like protein with peptidoglycan-binding domain
MDAGLYSGPVTGYFGPLTKAAVVKFQGLHGIKPQSGFVGPLTRAVLNQGANPTASNERNSVLQSLEAQLSIILAKIAALRAAANTTGQ